MCFSTRLDTTRDQPFLRVVAWGGTMVGCAWPCRETIKKYFDTSAIDLQKKMSEQSHRTTSPFLCHSTHAATTPHSRVCHRCLLGMLGAPQLEQRSIGRTTGGVDQRKASGGAVGHAAGMSNVHTAAPFATHRSTT